MGGAALRTGVDEAIRFGEDGGKSHACDRFMCDRGTRNGCG